MSLPSVALNSWFFGALVIGACAVVAWLFKRRLRERMWFPLLRILKQRHTPLPKLRFQPPPWFSWMIFLGVITLFLMATLRPWNWKDQPSDQTFPDTHIAIDLSPSVAAQTTIERYREQIKTFVADEFARQRLTLGASSQLEIIRPGTVEQAHQFIDQLKWQRSGTRMNSFVRQQLEQATSLQKLVIFSDRDLFTWQDFRWQDLGVTVVLNASDRPLSTNFYIRAAQCISEECTIELGRSGDLTATMSGAVLWIDGATTLLRSEWQFPAAQDTLKLKVTLNARPKTLMARLEVAGDELGEDDLYHLPAVGRERRALLIAAPAGERPVDDLAYYWQKALLANQVDLQRWDGIDQPGPVATSYPLWILGAGMGEGIDRFCPQSLAGSPSRSWLIPMGPDWAEVCACFIRIQKLGEERTNKICSQVVDEASLSEMLSSLGAKPLQGKAGQASTTSVWRVKGVHDQIVLSRPVPVASVPLVANELLQVMNLNAMQLTDLRTEPDITRFLLSGLPTEGILFNVPREESSLETMLASALPPTWNIEQHAGHQHSADQKRDEQPWAMWILGVLLSLLVVELIGSLSLPKRWLWVLLFGLWWFKPEPVLADVQMAFIGQYPPNMSQLKSEVEGRTSISLDEKAVVFSRFENRALRWPMIWAQNLNDLQQSRGLFSSLERWLKRGGFLVIEGVSQLSQVETLTRSAFSRGKWQPIPPDHELMRSFYLLQALPACGQEIWYGFQFDERLAIVAIPNRMTESLMDQGAQPCPGDREQRVRTFVNLLMVALATDYKKDQIHLPEVLKRLR